MLLTLSYVFHTAFTELRADLENENPQRPGEADVDYADRMFEMTVAAIEPTISTFAPDTIQDSIKAALADAISELRLVDERGCVFHSYEKDGFVRFAEARDPPSMSDDVFGIMHGCEPTEEDRKRAAKNLEFLEWRALLGSGSWCCSRHPMLTPLQCHQAMHL